MLRRICTKRITDIVICVPAGLQLGIAPSGGTHPPPLIASYRFCFR